MKAIKTAVIIIMVSSLLFACQPNSSDPANGSGDISSQEQAEIVAATLSGNKGGIGRDIDAIARPQSRSMSRAAEFSLNIEVTMYYYDAEDNLQEAYDPETTDRIDYEGIIQGELTDGEGFFQELSIDNRTDFMATELLSGTVVIDGTHSNHSSYSRIQELSNAEVHFDLACDLSAIGVAVDMNADDTFPEAGTIEGTVEGSYERATDFVHEVKELYFHFVAVYLGDNTAEIELNDGTVFIVQLATGEVEDLQEPE